MSRGEIIFACFLFFMVLCAIASMIERKLSRIIELLEIRNRNH
jgi:hypothetical protein